VIPLQIACLIEAPTPTATRPSVHRPTSSHRLHIVAITVSPKHVTDITRVGHEVMTKFDRTTNRSRPMNTFHYGHEPLSVHLLARRQLKRQGVAITVAIPMDLGGKPPRLRPRAGSTGPSEPPSPPPYAARVARIDVESRIQVARSIRRSSRSRPCRR
jgi:hypothetical protein